ncbi:hypothetical protein GALL_459620 [mine drainage metagenome]|uniref:Uncharacterized protein n=1 Tax=mine drainage metagenome TaxID=410659 RepID=A0A1J5PLJ9_9ZZZZ
MHPHHARAETGRAHGIAHHHGVILLPHPRFARVVRAGDQRLQRIQRVDMRHRGQRGGGRGFNPGAVIFRRGARQRLQRQVGLDLIAVHDEEAVFGDGFTDDGEVEIPFVKHRLGLGLFRGDGGGVQVGQLCLARRNVKREFVIETQRFLIKHIQRFYVDQQLMLVQVKIVGDLVDLALHGLEFLDKLGEGCRRAGQFIPPAPLAAHVEFRDGKALDRGDDGAERVACGPDVLALHIGQHRGGNRSQLGLCR